jgi:hypothetical protein
MEARMTLTADSLERMATRAVKQIDIDAGLLEQTRKAMSRPADAPDKALHEAQGHSDLTEEQALDLAYGELHAMRRERRQAA